MSSAYCARNHPANYKSCMIYKDLQKRHFPTLWKKEITTTISGQTCMHTIGNYPTRQNHLFLNNKNSKQSINCKSNLPGYSVTGSAIKPRPIHKKSHARIPERIERIHGQNVSSNLWLGNHCKNMQWKENWNRQLKMPTGWPNTLKNSKLSYSVKI